MNLNFELILFYAALITGVVCLFDILFLERHRKPATAGGEIKLPLIIDYSRSFFPVLLLVFLLRSFLFEPFRIPTGSLEPTLLVGDFILVNKYDYGIRMPVMHQTIKATGSPQRGDIVVFRYPPNPSVDYIKRVIGVPGDKISYINKELFINGQKIPQSLIATVSVKDDVNEVMNVEKKQEDLLGIKHDIYINPLSRSLDYHDIVVPKGMYFMMGDNRDNSADSRYWGFVEDKDIVGKAVMVWMSWDSDKFGFRWNRIGRSIH